MKTNKTECTKLVRFVVFLILASASHAYFNSEGKFWVSRGIAQESKFLTIMGFNGEKDIYEIDLRQSWTVI